MATKPSFHEDLGRAGEAKPGSERAFGMVFAAVFAAIAAFPLIGGGPVRLWALAVAAGFVAAAVLRPRLLGPFNRAWFRFGLLLHRIVTPMVMGLVFYSTVTPIALILRLQGKDPLRLRFAPEAKSYWIERRPPGPEPETMRNQF